MTAEYNIEWHVRRLATDLRHILKKRSPGLSILGANGGLTDRNNGLIRMEIEEVVRYVLDSVDPDRLRRIPDEPDLVSVREIAELLGVKHQTVHTWRARGILPEADFDLGVGPVWYWETIREWAKSSGRL